MTATTLDPNPADKLLALCKASADKLRLAILRVLSRDSFGVLELCAIFDCKQSSMSHHLKVLSSAGLIASRREGNSIFYRRASVAGDAPLQALQHSLLHSIDQLALDAGTRARIEQLQQERAERSREFFASNAQHFQRQQEQIAAYSLYGPAVAELLAKTCPQPAPCALELGPGNGEFLGVLARHFAQVVALDNAPAMLAQARAHCAAHNIAGVEFIEGDIRHPRLSSLQADCVVVNMVLHHLPSPAEVFFDIRRALRSGGQLLITELCKHDQAWTRDACGDVWLGFAPEELEQWASGAGFRAQHSVYLSQLNGFQVQIRQFVSTN